MLRETSVALGSLLRQRKVWGLAIGSAAYNYCFYLLLTWLPVYLETGVHFSARTAVLVTGVPWVIAAAVDFAVGGWLVDALIRHGRDPDRVRRGVLVGGTVLGLFIAAPALVHSPLPVVACLSVALSGLSAAAPVIWSLPPLLAGSGGAGRLASVVNLANQVAAISAPIATAYLLHRTHAFGAAFLVASGLVLVGIVSYLVLLGRVEPIA